MLRVGVIGVGAMGKNHVRVYSQLPDVQLVGIADADAALTQSLAKRYRTTPYSDYRDLLSTGLDAVSIAVPTSFHQEVAVEAARRRVHILLEKPIAESVAAAKAIIQAADRNGVKLMIGHIERFNPVVPVVRREIEGREVSLVEIVRIGPFPPRIKDVGVVVDLATHDIDLIRYITGSEFRKIFSLTSRILGPHEDAALLMFEMENGILARVSVNWLTPFKVREITIAARESFIRASLLDQRATSYSRYKENDSYLVKELRVPFGEPLDLELRAFVDSIKDDATPPVSGEDGLRALEVALSCIDKTRG